MLSKIRTTVITLVAASSFAFAVGPLAPVASASKNTGAFQKSSEGFKWKAQACEDFGQLFEKFVNEADKAYKAEGNSENFKNHLGAASMAAETARTGGCAWAS